ncbi:phage portal protein [Listeria newyorkensis]|nr:phage portal protein [Listeria newyorkensis]
MQWAKGLFHETTTESLVDQSFQSLPSKKLMELSIKKWAIDSCVNKIANALAKAEIQTFVEGEERREEDWYLFNIEPNPNQNATEFWKKAVYKLVYENEVLIFSVGNAMYVADSFYQKKFAFRENIYSNIVLKDYAVSAVFPESKVMHLTLNIESAKSIIDGFYRLYGDLISEGVSNYKKLNSRKFLYKTKGQLAQTKDAQEKTRDLLSNRIRVFLSEKDAVLPLQEGHLLEELEQNKANIAESRDIKKMVDDVFEMTANSFHIPWGVAKGDTVGLNEQMNSFLMFGLNPIAEMFSDEGNRKLYGKSLVLKRTYMKMDTSLIKVIDLKDSASALELLFRTGTNVIDDNLAMVGKERTGLPENNQRFISKNYAPQGSEDMRVQGGERNADE